MDRLWTLCLQAAGQRRLATPSARVLGGTADAGLAWQPEGGWQLQGSWAAEAQALFPLYKPLLDRQAGAPTWVIGQLGQSLDGCVATHSGDSCFVNGPENLVHLHRLRALSDAVLVGAGTVAADNPRLTTRLVTGPQPVRVVLDPRLRAPAGAGLFSDEVAPTLLLCDAAHAAAAVARLGAERVLAVPGLLGAGGEPCLAPAIAALQGRGLSLLFVEGGGVTVSRFLAQGCLDRLHLAIAPLLIGGGRPGVQAPRATRLSEALRPPCRTVQMGCDILWDLDLRGG